jgi:sugar-specific transcriptional regulator TrmB
MPPQAEGNPDPHGKGLFFDSDVAPQFQQLVKNANENIIFVTPYIELWPHLKDELRDAIERHVDITFLIREDHTAHKPENLEWLHANRVKVYLIPNLHAKIYLNEKTVLVSSMNVHRTSITDSKDFAMFIKNQEQEQMLREYVKRLIGKGTRTQLSQTIRDRVSDPVDKNRSTQPSRSIERRAVEYGYCIRSRDKISLDIDKPLCADCYRQWNKYQDEDYAEKYCHSCGNSAETTFAKPLCKACWKKSN